MGNNEMMFNRDLWHKHFSHCIYILTSHLSLPHMPLGDIQVGMMDKKGQLEVEIIRARGLVVKPGSKTLPGKNRRNSSIIVHNPHFSIERLCF